MDTSHPNHRLPPGPILMVADNEAIARGALAWAAACTHEGRLHRVRLAGPSAPAAIAAEATHLGAAAILWAGAPEVRALAAAAAREAGIPLLGEDALATRHA
jgi:hypothetical protein